MSSLFQSETRTLDIQYVRRRPCEFQLGKFNVLPGLDLAVRTMQRRERAKFIISSDLLYGEQGFVLRSLKTCIFLLYIIGCPPRIPSRAWSVFIVELISWIDYSLIEQLHRLKTTDDELTDDFTERLRIVQALRDMGNVTMKDRCLSIKHSVRFTIV
jgi:hypothetical protein